MSLEVSERYEKLDSQRLWALFFPQTSSGSCHSSKPGKTNQAPLVLLFQAAITSDVRGMFYVLALGSLERKQGEN